MKFLVMFKIFNSVIRFKITYIKKIYKNSNRFMRASRDPLWEGWGESVCRITVCGR